MPAPILLYPRKSHRKVINLPSQSVQLAELIGIIFGDGAIGNLWQVVISLNSISDLEYAQYVSDLFTHLFHISVSMRKRPNQNTLVVVCSSTSVVEYLVEHGAVRGNKLANGLKIPLWIKQNTSFLKAFTRGLIDTDGCIYHHRHFTNRHHYVNIGLCFTNYSADLILEIDTILKEQGINSHITDKGRRIYLYSEESVRNYLTIFGSSNPRIKEKYTSWRDARAV